MSPWQTRSATCLADVADAADTLRPYVESIFQLLHSIWEDGGRVEALMRASMGVLGDLAEAFPNGDYAQYYQAEWVTLLVKEVRSNRDNTARTIDTARWAREQVKRQLATIQSSQNL